MTYSMKFSLTQGLADGVTIYNTSQWLNIEDTFPPFRSYLLKLSITFHLIKQIELLSGYIIQMPSRCWWKEDISSYTTAKW